MHRIQSSVIGGNNISFSLSLKKKVYKQNGLRSRCCLCKVVDNICETAQGHAEDMLKADNSYKDYRNETPHNLDERLGLQ